MKKILITLILLAFCYNCAIANCENCNNYKHKPTKQEIKAFDEALIKRLNLDEEQQKKLKQNKSNHRKQMEPIIKEMQALHDEIKSIYNCSYHKFQGDLETAYLKAKLVLLKQKADKLREENRKNFEKILTDEQRLEFQKFKKE